MNRHAAVGRHRADPDPAAAERRVELAVQAALHGDWEVGADAAVNGARFELRRVTLRHGELDAAVVRRDVESHAVPSIAVEVDGQPAVGRLAFDFAAHVPEGDAAVLRAELGDALEVVDGDAAVVRAQRELRTTRHVNLELNGPAFAAVGLRAGRADMRRGLDADAGDDPARIRVRFGVPAHYGAHQGIAAVPADHLDAAVGASVDVQQPRRADGFFADLTEGRT